MCAVRGDVGAASLGGRGPGRGITRSYIQAGEWGAVREISSGRRGAMSSGGRGQTLLVVLK